MATLSKYRGKWRCLIRKKGHPVLSKTFEKYADAAAWGRDVEARIDAGETVTARPVRSDVTVASLLEWYLDLPETKAKASYKDDQYRAKHLTRLLGDIDTFSLTAQQLNRYKAERLMTPIQQTGHKTAKVPAAQTVQHELRLLHRAYVLAVEEFEWKLPHGIPKARRPQIRNSRERRVRQDELLRLIAATESPELGVVMELAVETAMRRGELLSMTWENVNLEGRRVLLPRTKNGEQRTVPLSPRAIELLQARYREGSTGPVFTVNGPSVQQALKRAAKRIGSEGLRFHDLRHEATSRLFEKGLNVIEVSRITGHKTLSMLNRYAHLDVHGLADKLAA
jgi:integrase